MIEVVIAALVIATACFFLAAVLTCLDRSQVRDDDLRRSTNTMVFGTDPWSKQSTKISNMLFIGIRFSTLCEGSEID